MAARSRLELTEAHRQKIQTSMLINRLQDHIRGEVEMSQTQITAALGLIRKTLPDLKAIELTGSDGEPLKIELVKFSDVVK